ncbi:MAG: hypothetical protein VSS75_032475 [Candidatus Parabeggiatoa sp.]|nr:hypothetical protein [Candidatus Parabeggiatoa sp.]
MIYTLTNTTDDEIITSHLKSFWLYVGFSVDPATGWITVNSGYAAFDYSEDSNNFTHHPPNNVPLEGAMDYEIKHHTNAIELFHASLVKSYKAEYANEAKRLHLVKFDDAQSSHTWFKDANYDPAFETPKKNRDKNPFLKREVSFDNLTDRYAFSVHTAEDENGLSALMLTLPFLKSGLVSNLLATQSQNPHIMPALTVKTIAEEEKEWHFFQGATPWPGAVKGFVMVCQGAFKTMDVNLCAEDWLQGGAFTQNDNTLFKELMRTTHQSSRFTRTVETVDETTETAVFPGSDDGPVEILYLDGLNSRGNVVVPPILVV